MSRLAKDEWEKLPNKVVRYFEALAMLAEDRHKEIYKGYKYKPSKKNYGKKSNQKNKRQKPTKTKRSPETIHKSTSEVALGELEEISETSPIENLNATEYNFPESTNFGYPSFDLPLFFDPSIPLSPLNFETSMITNVEQEIYPTFESTDFFPLSPLCFEYSEVINYEPETYPTFDSYPTLDSIDIIPISPLYTECFTINNEDTEICQPFEFIDFLPLYVEDSAMNNIEPEKYLIFDQLNFDEYI
ncbi:hypothetical protein F8M41_007057 [Gigaspora margarita]|uniref:HMG box domain-containing protein n=1 Tax=Gigaspora margarita TaxID=4874 RepID=A0A8H4EVG8_GIGMA|nr:hypothetical protein F8M41_007057 [Gigaspora margarita]